MTDSWFFVAVIASIIGLLATAFSIGLFIGSVSDLLKFKRQMPVMINQPTYPQSGGQLLDNSPKPQVIVKQKPTLSAVLKNPTPQEIRKQKEQEITTAFIEEHLKPKDSGSFAV